MSRVICKCLSFIILLSVYYLNTSFLATTSKAVKLKEKSFLELLSDILLTLTDTPVNCNLEIAKNNILVPGRILNKLRLGAFQRNTRFGNFHCRVHTKYLGMTSETNKPFTLSKSSTIEDFEAANKASTDQLKVSKPEILEISGKGQSPHTLWIGCSDSRVNECTALGCVPGEIFTVRNIGNVVTTGDLACISAIQFAIESLKVKRVVVCGHTDCGGMWGALSSNKANGPLDNWLLPVRNVRLEHLDELDAITDGPQKNAKLSELNVLHSVEIVRRHPSFVKAHKECGVEVYGLLYDVKTGYLKQVSSANSQKD